VTYTYQNTSIIEKNKKRKEKEKKEIKYCGI
jgi:hypothetical protein